MPLGELFGMLIGFGLVVGLPLTAILTHHQRKMVEMLHRQRMEQGATPQADRRILQLEAEVFELKQALQNHIISTDGRYGSTLEGRMNAAPSLTPEAEAQVGRSLEP